MIHFLATRDHLYTIRRHLEVYGSGLAGLVVPLAYEDVFARVADAAWWDVMRESWWPVPLEAPGRDALEDGTYVFADIERLSPFDAMRAATVWTALAERGPAVRLLNHPTQSMRRYELLRTLHEDGVNAFDVYRLTEARWPRRYPVFVRDENDHLGARFPLLHDQAELAHAIAMMDGKGRSREGVLAVEFCNTADAQGLYRKFGAYVVGDRIVPKNVLFNSDWVVKVGWGDLPALAVAAEEDAYLAGNPHEETLRSIARRARIEYGRIDYGVLNGRVQVWEINTNPMITAEGGEGAPTRPHVLADFSRRFEGALHAITPGAQSHRS